MEEEDLCPVPGPAIANPFQPLEDFMKWKQQKRSSTGNGNYACQNPSPNPNPNLGSFLPSSDFPDLSPPADDYNKDDAGLFLNDQDEQNNMAMSNDNMDPTSIFSAQNEIGPDDLISSNVNYDNFLDPGNAIGGGGSGTADNDIAMLPDHDIFSNAV